MSLGPAQVEFLGWLHEEELWSLAEACGELRDAGIAERELGEELLRLHAAGLVEVIEVVDGDLVAAETSGRRLGGPEVAAALAQPVPDGFPPFWVAPTDATARALGLATADDDANAGGPG